MDRVESLETGPCIYRHLIYEKDGTSEQWGKDNFINKRCWVKWISKWEKNKA